MLVVRTCKHLASVHLDSRAKYAGMSNVETPAYLLKSQATKASGGGKKVVDRTDATIKF